MEKISVGLPLQTWAEVCAVLVIHCRRRGDGHEVAMAALQEIDRAITGKTSPPEDLLKIGEEKPPRVPSIVVYKETPHERRHFYLYLGEVANMEGHAAVLDMETGKFIGCYHTDNFREATPDEL